MPGTPVVRHRVLHDPCTPSTGYTQRFSDVLQQEAVRQNNMSDSVLATEAVLDMEMENAQQSPWVQATGWLQHLDGCLLPGLHAATLPPGSPQQLPQLEVYWEGVNRDQYPERWSTYNTNDQILYLVCEAFDQVFDRCLATLRETHDRIREVFGTKRYGGAGNRPVGLPLPETVKKYCGIWRRFLILVFRSSRLAVPDQERHLRLNLDKQERYLIEVIWDFLTSQVERDSTVKVGQGATCPQLNHPNHIRRIHAAQQHFQSLAEEINEDGLPSSSNRTPQDGTSVMESVVVPSSIPAGTRRRRNPSLSSVESRCGIKRQRMMRGQSRPLARRKRFDRGQNVGRGQNQHLHCNAGGLTIPDKGCGVGSGSSTDGETGSNWSPTEDITSTGSASGDDSASVVSSSSDNSMSGDSTDSESDSPWRAERDAISDLSDSGSEFDIPDHPDVLMSSVSVQESSRQAELRVSDLPPAGQRWLKEAVFDLCITALASQSIYMTGNKFHSSLVCYAAILGIHPGDWRLESPYTYTSKLAAMLWVSRVLLLEYALPRTPYSYLIDIQPFTHFPDQIGRAKVVVSVFAGEDQFTPILELTRLLAKGMAITRRETRPPNIMWSKESQVIHHTSLPLDGLSMATFRRWVQGLIHTTETIFHQDILRGMQPTIRVGHLADSFHETSAGFSFLSLRPDLNTCKPMLGYCGAQHSGDEALFDGKTWHKAPILEYLKCVRQFLERLAVVIQLTWGVPCREKELLSITWRNRRSVARNIYLLGQMVMVVTTDPKTRDRTESTEKNVHFLLPVISDIVVQYLIYIHPLVISLQEDILVGQLNGPVGAAGGRPGGNDHCYLFKLPGRRPGKIRGQITPWLRQLSLEGLGIPLTTLVYRHIAIAVAKRHLQVQTGTKNAEAIAKLLESIFAHQAGHKTAVHRQVYAIDKDMPKGLTLERLEAFLAASQAWHEFILAKVPDTVPPSKPGRPVRSRPSVTKGNPTPKLAKPQSSPTCAPRDTGTVYGTVWDVLSYYPEWKLLLCRECKAAVKGGDQVQHARGHVRSKSIGAAVQEELTGLEIAWMQTVHAQLRQGPLQEPFVELPVHEGKMTAPTKPCKFVGIEYDQAFVDGLEGSAPKLAGAFGLKDTIQLWDLYNADEDFHELIDDYINHRKANYGETNLLPKHLAVKPQVMEVAYSPELQPIFSAPAKPSIASAKIKPEMLATVTVIWYVIRMVRTKPSLFPRSRAINDIRLDRYDLLHGWKLLAFFWKQISSAKASKNPQRNQASRPTYHRPAGVSTVVETASRPPTTEELFGLATSDMLALAQREDNEAEELDEERLPVASDMEVAEMISKGLDSGKMSGLERPPMDAAVRSSLLKHMLLSDSFGKYCILSEPESTDVPDRESSDGSISMITTLTTQAEASRLAKLTGPEQTEMGASEEPQEPVEPVEPVESVESEAVENTDGEQGDNEPRPTMMLSARPPSYHAACERLQLDADNPVLKQPGKSDVEVVQLKKWQVSGVSWMLDQESTPVGGGILGDNCGLGKTVQALSLILLAAEQPAPPETLFRPTLVLCQSVLIDTWLSEYYKYFGDVLELWLFHGSSAHTSDFRRKNIIVDSTEELRAKVKALDPKDTKTAKVVILSTYATWSTRTLNLKADGPEKRATRAKANRTPGGDEEGVRGEESEDEEDDDGIGMNTQDADEKRAINVLADLQDSEFDRGRNLGHGPKAKKPLIIDTVSSRLRGLFARVVADEGHALKQIRTYNHQAVAKLEARTVWFLTATPMSNRALDLCGYLALLWKDAMKLQVEENPDDDGAAEETAVAASAPPAIDPVAEYQPYSDLDSFEALDAPPYHLLSPRRFASLATKGHLAARRGYHCLPVIMRLLCLARDMGQPVDPRDLTVGIIGSDIPPLRMFTVELRHPAWAQRLHDRRWAKLLARIKQGRKIANSATAQAQLPGESQGFRDWETMRRLTLLAWSPKLEFFVRKVGSHRTFVDALKKYMDRPDRGFGLYWTATRFDRADMVPANRLGMARYLMADCPRLRYLLKIFFSEGLFASVSTAVERPRFLLFCSSPLVLWHVSMFLDAISVPFVTIRSTMNETTRSQSVAMFTDVNAQCDVLLTTYQVGAHGLNLHGACANVVLLESANNVSIILQAIGRLHRIGQLLKQKAWLLFQDETIARFIEYNAAKKGLPLIAAQLHDILKPDLDRVRHRTQESLKQTSPDMSEDDRAAAVAIREADFIDEAADRAMRELFGQPRSRLGWGDIGVLRDADGKSNRPAFEADTDTDMATPTKALATKRKRSTANPKSCKKTKDVVSTAVETTEQTGDDVFSGDGNGNKRDSISEDDDKDKNTATKVADKDAQAQ
ncbi:hypothetical protein BJX61DRAFT_544160 [Aspergillus egyptiacus]|nr:hypothetical protein BJX61DRAFT_544160 [Aspergillus egyptiacus]